MLHKPEAHPLFNEAKYIVGVDFNDAARIYFDRETACENADKHLYLNFFDDKGIKIGSSQVVGPADGYDAVYLDDDY